MLIKRSQLINKEEVNSLVSLLNLNLLSVQIILLTVFSSYSKMFTRNGDLDYDLLSFVSYYQSLRHKQGPTTTATQTVVTRTVSNKTSAAWEVQSARKTETESGEGNFKVEETPYHTRVNYLTKNVDCFPKREEITVPSFSQKDSDFAEHPKSYGRNKKQENSDLKSNIEIDSDLDTTTEQTHILKRSSATDLSKYFTKIPTQTKEGDEFVWSRWKLALLDDTDDNTPSKQRPRRKKSVLEQRIDSEINSAFLKRNSSLSMPNISSLERSFEGTCSDDMSSNLDPSSTDNIPEPGQHSSTWAIFSTRIKSSMSSSVSLFGSLWSLDETNNEETASQEDNEENRGVRERVASAPYGRERRRSMFSVTRGSASCGHARSYSACNDGDVAGGESLDVSYERNVSDVEKRLSNRKRFESAPNVRQLGRKKSWYDLVLQE